MGQPEKMLLLVLLATTALALPSSSDLPKPSYARTMLKVSRSLPGETEELKVRTSEGNLATLIVKRREKSVSSDTPIAAPPSDGQSSSSTPSPIPSNASTAGSGPSPSTTAEPATTTIGYQNVEVDPWSRLQTWSSVSEARRQPPSPPPAQEEESRSWVPVSRDSWQPLVAGARGFQSLPANGDEQVIRYAFLPHEPRPRTNVGANLMKNRDAKNVPAEVVVRSEINVKPQPGQPGQPQQAQAKRLPVTLDADGTPVVHGRRVPDEPIDKIQIWRNARVINDQLVTDGMVPTAAATTARVLTEPQNFERFFEDVNRRYGKTPGENLVKGRTYRNEALAAEIYEAAEEEGYRPSIRKRMLQPELPTAVYPNSRIYSPPDTPKPVVKPGTRAPVLQYAHPELGVQPAKVAKSEKRTQEAVSYSEMSAPPKPSTSYPYGEHRQKKKYVLNDKNIVDSYTYKNYYPNQHFYGLKRPEAPFWVRVSENIKSQFTDGVNKVSELTKPVFDPLVEATRKISENLGLSRSQDPAQDKVGSVATSGSVLIPALGLVASGAALGIGAVAVGRYLDVDVLKRSNEDEDDEEATRALRVLPMLEEGQRMTPARDEAVANSNGLYILYSQDDRTVTRRKRSSVDDDTRRMQRKGADPIAEIVEIDVPSSEASENELRLENEEALAQAIVEQTIEAIAGAQAGEEEPRARRRRDAELDDALQNLENAEVAEAAHVPGDWSNTPCAKRIFCDAMLQRGSDARVFMEKKMAGLLRMIQPGAAVQVSSHFDEVMDAVRRHDCSIFSCPQARPASVFF